MPAVQRDLKIEQGTDWSTGWRVTVNGAPIDATWTARSQVRKTVAATEILHTFAADVDAAGNVVIAVTPTESIPWTWRTAVYDVEVVNADASLTLRLAEGRVTVDPEVTR